MKPGEGMMRVLRASAVVVGLVVCASSLGSAQTTDEQMKKDIEALKAGQEAIQKDLAEIKRLLQTRPAAADALPRDPIAIASEPFKGNGTAKVALIEFSDYQCPFCSRYSRDTLPRIVTDYIDTGKIRYVFRDLPLSFHKQAFKAAEAAHCAGAQDKFWEMHDLLFQNQARLKRSHLEEYARRLKLDVARFAAELDTHAHIGRVRADLESGARSRVRGTPGFFVNGRIVDVSFGMRALFDAAEAALQKRTPDTGRR
jgi:protein-disulfide isomerase